MTLLEQLADLTDAETLRTLSAMGARCGDRCPVHAHDATDTTPRP